jgi:hypothetical protein
MSEQVQRLDHFFIATGTWKAYPPQETQGEEDSSCVLLYGLNYFVLIGQTEEGFEAGCLALLNQVDLVRRQTVDSFEELLQFLRKELTATKTKRLADGSLNLFAKPSNSNLASILVAAARSSVGRPKNEAIAKKDSAKEAIAEVFKMQNMSTVNSGFLAGAVNHGTIHVHYKQPFENIEAPFEGTRVPLENIQVVSSKENVSREDASFTSFEERLTEMEKKQAVVLSENELLREENKVLKKEMRSFENALVTTQEEFRTLFAKLSAQREAEGALRECIIDTLHGLEPTMKEELRADFDKGDKWVE